MFRRPWPATTALMFLVFGAMFLAMGIILHGSWQDWQRAQGYLEDRALSIARFYQSRQITLTTSTEILLQTLAEIPLLEPGKEEALTEFLARLDAAQPDYMGFTVVNPEGKSLATVAGGRAFPSLPPERMLERDYFNAAVQERRFSIGQGQASRRVDNVMFLPLATPSLNADGTVRAVVVALLDMRRSAEDQQGQNIMTMVAEHGAQVRILDRKGVILYQYPADKSLATGAPFVSVCLEEAMATPGSLKLSWQRDSQNEEYLCVTEKLTLAHSDKPYMFVQVHMPSSSWLRFFFLNYYYAVFAVVTSLVFATLVSRLAGRYFFVDGLVRLVRVASSTREGHMDMRNGPLRGCREIQTLGKCMDQMLDDLQRGTSLLHEERGRLDMALDAANMGTWQWTDARSFLCLDERCWRHLGYASDMSEGRNGLSIMHEEDMGHFTQAKVSHVMGQTSHFNCELRMRRFSGEWVWLLLAGKHMLSDLAVVPGLHGEASDVSGVFLDITLRRQLEDLEREKAEYYKRLSTMDGLTGLWNRRYFNEAALVELQRCMRYGRPLALIMADIDHFKLVNDTYGHAAGDEVLRCFAKLMSDSVRSSDMVARFGGEEFVLLLPETELSAAVAVAEKIRLGLSSMTISHEKVQIVCTSSFGVCGLGAGAVQKGEEFAKQASTVLEQLVSRADAALYAAKGEGRNKVRFCALHDAKLARRAG